MKSIYKLSKEYGFRIIEDASHALGAIYDGKKVGDNRYSDFTIFSFHPVKIITSGEGGMLLTNERSIFEKSLRLRRHGITKEQSLLNEIDEGPWQEIVNPNNLSTMISSLIDNVE